jgi:hypothetical protein
LPVAAMSNPFEVLKIESAGAGTPSGSDERIADEEQIDVSLPKRSDIVSRRDVERTPITQWLRVVKPAKSDVHVRVTEPFSDMEHLPSNCSLMAVSNVWDLAIIGDATGMSLSPDLAEH